MKKLLVTLLLLSIIISSCKEKVELSTLNPDSKVRYFRLRQVDIDNTESFSKIVSVTPGSGRTEATMLNDQCGNQITGFYNVVEDEITFEPINRNNNNQGYYMYMNEPIADVDGNLINGNPVRCIDGKAPVGVTYNQGQDRYTIPFHPANAYSYPYSTISIGNTVFVIFNQPLPITLISFTAIRTGQGIRIDFETAYEHQSDYIEIQHSYEPTHPDSWETVTRIKSLNLKEGSSYTYLLQ